MSSNSLPLLGVFAKQPEAGKVKTRLARTLGESQACDLYKVFVADTLQLVLQAEIDLTVCYSPATSEAKQALSALCPQNRAEEMTWWPQPEGDLGTRMGQFFEEFVLSQNRASVLIGTDSPHLSRETLFQAFEILKQKPAVLGPCEDGGYYLIGFSEYQPGLLEGIEWSVESTFQQTAQAIENAGLNYGVLSTGYDIDTGVELKRMIREFNESDPQEDHCQKTKQVLAEMGLYSP